MKKIYLRTVGSDDSDIPDLIIPRLKAAFHLDVERYSSLDLPERAFDSDRHQYLSSAFFPVLEFGLPEEALRVLGMTDVDMYVPHLSFVFGEAKLGGPSAVISTYRLRTEYYGESHNNELFIRRVQTEAVHELGHTFGLLHCPNPNCVMYFSSTIIQTDRKGSDFCEECFGDLEEAFKRGTAGFTRSGGSSE